MKVRDAIEALATMNPDAGFVVGAVVGNDEDFVPVHCFENDTTTGRPLVVLIPDDDLKRRYPRP